MLHIQLQDIFTDEKMEIAVPATMPIAEFADEVRKEMNLPYTASVRFRQLISNGRVYMKEEAIPTYVDMLWEGGDDPADPDKKADIYDEDFYIPEDGVCVDELFTVTGSSCRYIQGDFEIRCTLVERE